MPLLAAATLTTGVAAGDEGGLVAAETLITDPAVGDEDDTPVPSDPYEHYGDIGCTVVPGFNDRCPTMVSEPLKSRAGEFARKHWLQASPDGSMLYAVGNRDDGATYWETTITAFRAAPGNVGTDGTVAWSRSFGGSAEFPQVNAIKAALSHDGSRLFVAGEYWINSNQKWLIGVQNSWAAAFDTATGDTIWARQLPAPIDRRASQPGGVVVSPDDSLVVVSAGISHLDSQPQTGARQEAWYFALNASSGDLKWQTDWTAHNPNWPGSRGPSMAVSPDGSRLFAQITLQRQDGDKLPNVGNATVAFDTASGDLVWERRYLYPPEDGTQNPPRGLSLSPDGRRVFAIARHGFDPDSGGFATRARFQLFAYDAANGEPLWSEEYSGNAGTGCDEENFVGLSNTGSQRAIALGPSGNVLYLVGHADYRHPSASDGACSSYYSGSSMARPGTVVLAVDAGSGALRWEEHFGQDGGWSCLIGQCDIAVVPGPRGDDVGSQLLVSTNYLPDGATYGYPWTLALDGTSGALLWQGRYLDTYNDGQTFVYMPGGAASTVNPDGSRLYRLLMESSSTREWRDVAQVLGYDLHRDFPDLIPTTLTVSKGQKGHQRELTVTVANDGSVDAEGVVVRFFNGDRALGDSEPVTIKAGERVTVSYLWDTLGASKPYHISALVNPDQTVAESDYDNNRIQQE